MKRPVGAVIKLKYPLDNISEIKLHRPTIGDILEIQELDVSDAEKELLLFEKLTGVPKETLRQLDIEDYQALQNAYSSFTQKKETEENEEKK